MFKLFWELITVENIIFTSFVYLVFGIKPHIFFPPELNIRWLAKGHRGSWLVVREPCIFFYLLLIKKPGLDAFFYPLLYGYNVVNWPILLPTPFTNPKLLTIEMNGRGKKNTLLSPVYTKHCHCTHLCQSY